MNPEEKKSLIERWKDSGNIFLQILASLLELGKEISANPEKDSEKQDSKAVEPEKTAASPEAAKLDIKGKEISLSHTWVSDQI